MAYVTQSQIPAGMPIGFPDLPLVELESITVASTKVQNHSNDPNYLAASWYDIWLAS